MENNLEMTVASGVLLAGSALAIYFLWGVLARPGRRKRSLVRLAVTIFLTLGSVIIILPQPAPPSLAEQEAKQAKAKAAERQAREQAAKAEAVKQAAQMAAAKAEVARQAACRADLRCWAEANASEASAPCQRSIERLAKYEMKWTNGLTEPRLSMFNWADKKAGTIVYFGDKAMFQNGYGAYQNVIYSCAYDPISGLIVNASVEPGRL